MTTNKKAVVIHGAFIGDNDDTDELGQKLLKKYKKKNLIIDWDGRTKLKSTDLAWTRSAPHLISGKYEIIDLNIAKEGLV